MKEDTSAKVNVLGYYGTDARKPALRGQRTGLRVGKPIHTDSLKCTHWWCCAWEKLLVPYRGLLLTLHTVFCGAVTSKQSHR